MRGSVKAGLVGGLKSLTVAISCIFHAADFGSPKPIWVFEHVRRGLKLYGAGQRNRRRFVLEPRGKGITRRDHREEHWSPRTSAHAQAGYRKRGAARVRLRRRSSVAFICRRRHDHCARRHFADDHTWQRLLSHMANESHGAAIIDYNDSVTILSSLRPICRCI
jgi:hypothetical protein